MVVVLPIGGAEEGGPHPGDGLDLVAAGGEVGGDLLGGEGVVKWSWWSEWLITSWPASGEGFYRFRVFLHPVPHHEEGGLDVGSGPRMSMSCWVSSLPQAASKVREQTLVVPLHAVHRQLPLGGGGGDVGGEGGHQGTGRRAHSRAPGRASHPLDSSRTFRGRRGVWGEPCHSDPVLSICFHSYAPGRGSCLFSAGAAAKKGEMPGLVPGILPEFVAVFRGIGYNAPDCRGGPEAGESLLTCHLFWHIIS